MTAFLWDVRDLALIEMGGVCIAEVAVEVRSRAGELNLIFFQERLSLVCRLPSTFLFCS